MIRRLLAIVLGVAFLFISFSPTLSNAEFAPSQKAKAVHVVIVGEDGTSAAISGFKAACLYEKLRNVPSLLEAPKVLPPHDSAALPNDSITPKGMFTGFKYRYIETSRSSVHTGWKIASSFFANYSSLPQNYSVTASGSVSWSLNVELKGKFLDVFNAHFGAEWKKTDSFAATLSITL